MNTILKELRRLWCNGTPSVLEGNGRAGGRTKGVYSQGMDVRTFVSGKANGYKTGLGQF